MRILLRAALAGLLGGAATLVAASIAPAAEAGLEEARSVAELGMPSGPGAIRFADRQAGIEGATPDGLMPFSAWARARPEQRTLLALHPTYAEAVVTSTVHGLAKSRQERLQVYVAAARMVLDRPASSIDLARLASAASLAKVDPSIRHKAITRDEAIPNRDPEQPYNKRPDRAWCEGAGVSCFESRYDLEGKLPLGIKLANKLEDGSKKIADHVTFQSELRVLGPGDLDAEAAARLTGLPGPVTGALEQSIFHVNQIMRFGKLLAIVQPSPSSPERAVVSLYLALAVKADVLERKKEYERVPVLRNLVPAQVLMGQSSFNTGQSLSAGLPAYAKSRIRLLAAMLASS